MSAKINLAPEVYQNSRRNKQRKAVATTIGVMVGCVAVGLVGVAFVALSGQQVYLKDVNRRIGDFQQKLSEKSQLNDAVTTQQNLKSVVDLFGKRVYLSKFFDNMEQILPVGVALESIQIDPANTVTISGTAGNFNLATKFAKVLSANNTEVGPNASPQNTPYFTDIALVSADAGPTGKVGFKITAKMAPEVVAPPESSGSGGSSAK